MINREEREKRIQSSDYLSLGLIPKNRLWLRIREGSRISDSVVARMIDRALHFLV